MIDKCPYKIEKWSKTSRVPNVKCKKTRGFVVICVGEENCEYIKRQNEVLKEDRK